MTPEEQERLNRATAKMLTAQNELRQKAQKLMFMAQKIIADVSTGTLPRSHGELRQLTDEINDHCISMLAIDKWLNV